MNPAELLHLITITNESVGYSALRVLVTARYVFAIRATALLSHTYLVLR